MVDLNLIWFLLSDWFMLPNNSVSYMRVLIHLKSDMLKTCIHGHSDSVVFYPCACQYK